MRLARTDPRAAEGWLRQATETAGRSGNPYTMAMAAQHHARVANLSERPAEARRLFLEAARQFRAIDDPMELVCQSEVAHILRHEGLLADAGAMYRETIHGWQHRGNRGAIANQLECFAYLALAGSVAVRAARLLGAAEALRERAGAPIPPQERPEYEAALERLRGALNEDARSAAWADGRSMSGDEAVAFALSP
jgi:hypothetical protein